MLARTLRIRADALPKHLAVFANRGHRTTTPLRTPSLMRGPDATAAGGARWAGAATVGGADSHELDMSLSLFGWSSVPGTPASGLQQVREDRRLKLGAREKKSPLTSLPFSQSSFLERRAGFSCQRSPSTSRPKKSSAPLPRVIVSIIFASPYIGTVRTVGPP